MHPPFSPPTVPSTGMVAPMSTHSLPPPGPDLLPALGSAHRSLRDQVADVVRERIVGGDLPPGTRLVERVLAEGLGVSRVPVRDALNLLKGEGFVTQEPRRGVVVARLLRKDIEELFDVRLALEVLAVRLATERATPDELKALKKALSRSAKALKANDTATLGHTNQAFHDAITAMAHNDLLISLLEPLEGRLHWLLRQNNNPRPLHREHVALYESIASGDSDLAGRVAAQHVRTSRELCLQRLYPDNGSDPVERP